LHLIKKHQKQFQAIKQGEDERLVSLENIDHYRESFLSMIHERNAYEKYGVGIGSFKIFTNNSNSNSNGDNDLYLDKK
jgi:hypothetical protein